MGEGEKMTAPWMLAYIYNWLRPPCKLAFAQTVLSLSLSNCKWGLGGENEKGA